MQRTAAVLLSVLSLISFTAAGRTDDHEKFNEARTRGKKFLAEGKKEEALVAFQEAVAAYDHDTLAWNDIAFLQIQAGRFDDARTAALKAIDVGDFGSGPKGGLLPNEVRELASAHYNLGRSEEGRADMKAARAAYARSIGLRASLEVAKRAVKGAESQEVVAVVDALVSRVAEDYKKQTKENAKVLTMVDSLLAEPGVLEALTSSPEGSIALNDVGIPKQRFLETPLAESIVAQTLRRVRSIDCEKVPCTIRDAGTVPYITGWGSAWVEGGVWYFPVVIMGGDSKRCFLDNHAELWRWTGSSFEPQKDAFPTGTRLEYCSSEAKKEHKTYLRLAKDGSICMHYGAEPQSRRRYDRDGQKYKESTAPCSE